MANEDKKATLLARLQKATELEIATIPPYMVALLSMKLSSNREAANLIRSVMIEEMLHLALVANVLNAVGGTVHIGPDTIPSYPLQMNFKGQAFKDREFAVDLAPFSKDNIQTFMKIEEPLKPIPVRATLLKSEIDIPGLTIGEFYESIVLLLEELDAAEPGTLFIGDPARQLHEDYYWAGGGKIIPVSDLVSAKAALDIVIVQGEGAWPGAHGKIAFSTDAPLMMGHYYRYSEIYYQRLYKQGDNPADPPTGEPLPIDYSAVYPIKVNPKARDYAPGSDLAKLNLAFNERYTMMLKQLLQALSGTPKELYTAIMTAKGMMSTPIDSNDPDSRNGCPTFDWVEVPESKA